jgi:hypothetical protein
MDTEIVNLFANVGFPVAITTYLLIRLEKQLVSLTNCINKLNTIISTKLGVVVDTSDDKKPSC